MRATLTLQRAEREVINPGFGSVGQKSYSPRRAKWISVQGTHFNEQFTQENRAIKIALSAGADSRNRVWQSQSTAKVTASVSHDASIASVIPYDGPQTITPFRAEWDALLRTSEHVNALYQSPEYFEHLASFGENHPHVTVVRDKNGEVRGIVPYTVQPYSLKFDLWGKVWFKKSFRAAKILGSELLLPSRAECHDAFLSELRLAQPDCNCVVFESVPEQSYLNHYLLQSNEIRSHWLVHVPEGTRRYPLIRLPATYEAYASKFSKKSRYNMKREFRRLQDECGPVQLIRVSFEDQVEAFVQGARSITSRSWSQGWLDRPMDPRNGLERVLTDFARRGILRSYVLKCGETPCAFAWGYQFAGVYTLVETAFDQKFAKYSPGKVLLSSIIEDLISRDRPQILTFDFGEAFYKELFANWVGRDRTVVLFRRGMTNRFWCRIHRLFRSIVSSIRTRVKSKQAEPR